MSYFLLPTGPSHIVGAENGLIKKHELEAFTEAASLLRRASEIHDQANAKAAAARDAAWAEGYAAGAAAANDELKQQLLRFADAVTNIADLHSRHVAEAAYAATAAIIGDFSDSKLVGRMAEAVVAKQQDISGIHILVNPDVYAQLAGSTKSEPSPPFASSTDLGPTDCHVVTANGRIIANLSVQLAVLRERWGISAEAERS